MKHLFHIAHYNQLYEFETQGITITRIRHWLEDRRTYYDRKYRDLPEAVKTKLILKLKQIKRDDNIT